MKQGRASRNVREGGEPKIRANAVSVSRVSQIGVKEGNHVTEGGTLKNYRKENLYQGRGIEAPRMNNKIHGKGSQGSY